MVKRFSTSGLDGTPLGTRLAMAVIKNQRDKGLLRNKGINVW